MIKKSPILLCIFVLLLFAANAVAVEKATNPDPANGAIDVDDSYAIIMSWTSGDNALSHDFYLGTDYDAVSNATTSSDEFIDNRGRPTYAFEDFQGNTTYYWRVDEVTSTGKVKGDIWNFKTYNHGPVAWYKFEAGSGEIAYDYSGCGNDANLSETNRWDDQGFDGSGCLSNDRAWGSFYGEVPATAFETVDTAMTITYWAKGSQNCYTYGNGGFFKGSAERGGIFSSGIYRDGEGNQYIAWSMGADSGGTGQGTLWWWNYNATDELNFENWQHFAMVKDCDAGVLKLYYNGVLAQNYSCDTSKNMEDITAARFFNRSTTSNQWWDPWHGKMDDVKVYDHLLTDEEIQDMVGTRFKYAWAPDPADGGEGVLLDSPQLSFQPGQGAVSHQIYFSDDRLEVKYADTESDCYKGERTSTTYSPGNLELMKTYYWRVDEVDQDDNLWKGDVWEFSSIRYTMVEDFESYDNEGNDITAVWLDKIGWGDIQITLMDQEDDAPNISPANSMKFRCHVPYEPYYAVAETFFDTPQDWTVNGVKMLTINYYGTENNFDMPIFVTVGDGITDVNVLVTGSDTTIEQWQEINIPLADFVGVDMNNISHLEIGFGDGTDIGMSSSQWDVIYIDNIVLYPGKCVLSESQLTADVTEDCVVDIDDLAVVANSWLRGSSAEAIAAANPVGLWLFDDPYDLTKAEIGNDLTVSGNAPVAASGIEASDGAAMVELDSYLIVDHDITPTDGNNINEYTMVWDVKIPADSAYGPLRWVALCEFDTVDLTTDVDISVIYAKGGVGYLDGLFGTHQGWSEPLVTPDKWYQLAVSVKNGEFFRCYVNGEFVLETPVQAVDGRYSIEDTFHLFKDNDQEDPDIYCSTFALFDRALTDAEIMSLVPIQLVKGDINDDIAIDFADYSIVADEWLLEDLWP